MTSDSAFGALPVEVLLWSLSTAIQVSLLAFWGLLACRFLRPYAVVRYGLLLMVLLLMVLAPFSTSLMQHQGLGWLELAGRVGLDGTGGAEPTGAGIDPPDAAMETRYRKGKGEETRWIVGSSRPVTAKGPEDLGIDREESEVDFKSDATKGTIGLEDRRADSDGIGLFKDRRSLAWGEWVREWIGFAGIDGTWMMSWLCRVWFCGMGVMAARWFVAWIRLKQCLERAKPVSIPEVLEAFSRAWQRVGGERLAPKIKVSEEVSTPVVMGIVSPSVVVPEWLCPQLSSAQWESVFLHELAHVVRRDPLVLAVQQWTHIVYWILPWVGSVNRRLRRASEEVCDNFVLAWVDPVAYGRTLLDVTEQGTSLRSPFGAIGMVGSEWSLRERVAGLLDVRRATATRLRAADRFLLMVMAVLFSSILILTFRVPGGIVDSQQPLAEVLGSDADIEQGLRGSGDTLEIRLHGQLRSRDGKQLVDPQVVVGSLHGSLEDGYKATVKGDRYEVWLPAKRIERMTIQLLAFCEDQQRGSRRVQAIGLRKAIQEGVDIELLPVERSVRVAILHQSQPSPNANVKVRTTDHPTGTVLKCDDRGLATIGLTAQEQLTSITAWTESGLLGSRQFQSKTADLADSTIQQVELIQCEERQLRVVDTSGQPVEGIHLEMDVVLNRPQRMHMETPDNPIVVSDANGKTRSPWFPKDVECSVSVRVREEEWVFQAQREGEREYEVLVVPKIQERVVLEGSIVRNGRPAAGVMVWAQSYQGEAEGRADIRMSLTDQAGNFSVRVLPQSEYCFFVYDDRWVSDPVIAKSVDAQTGKVARPELTAMDGYPLTIELTSGAQRQPIAGEFVTLIFEYPHSWTEKGTQLNGTFSRQIFVQTDEQGLATAFVPMGRNHGLVLSSDWHADAETEVKPGKDNRMKLHRPDPAGKVISGRLVAPSGQQVDWSQVSLSIQAIDGKVDAHWTPKVDEGGRFEFETKSAIHACFVYADAESLSAAILIETGRDSIDIQLVPSGYLFGQLLDEDGQAIAGQSIKATPGLHHELEEKRRLSNPFTTQAFGRAATTKTDAHGNYRIGPVPRFTPVRVSTDLLEPDWSNETVSLATCYLELNETRPPMVHRLQRSVEPRPKRSVEESMAVMLRDAELGGYHALAIIFDRSDDRCLEFVRRHFMGERSKVTEHFFQRHLDSGKSGTGKEKLYAIEREWPIPPSNGVTAIAFDAHGDELGMTTIDVTESHAKDLVEGFIEEHLPPRVDAQLRWEAAFELARKTHRQVWVRIGQRNCEPCCVLSRWLDDHREVLSKDFVMLKTDDLIDLHGEEIADSIRNGRQEGVPFFAFLDADQKVLIDSRGPLGNIGCIADFEGRKHFRRMLERVRIRLTDQEIDELVRSLEN